MKQKTVWLGMAMAIALLAVAGCKPGDPWRSTGSYPIDIFQEMHYNQSYKAQEPPRFSAPSDSIPRTGGFIAAPTKAEAADLTSPFAIDDQTLERGALLFKQNCSMCHGATAEGDGKVGEKFAFVEPPPSFAGARIQDLTPGQAYGAISRGEGFMPPFQSLLSEEDRWALVALIEASASDRTSRLQALDKPNLTGEARVVDEIDRVLRLNEIRAQ